jgi:putative hydrolase of the HAD superfamily
MFTTMRPKIIFFDAVGTLFGVRGTVGQIYGQFAQQAGLNINEQDLDRAFIQSFKAAPRAAFLEAGPKDLLTLEYQWWRAIAHQSFSQVGATSELSDFDKFFQPLFDHFATADPWVVYPETTQVLSQLKTLGIELAIVSNFDSRLYAVLEALELSQWFASVTISTHVGSAKPEPAIFEAALANHGRSPQDAWHVGDSWSEDYEGAVAAGLKGIWLNRRENAIQPARPTTREINDLTALSSILNS